MSDRTGSGLVELAAREAGTRALIQACRGRLASHTGRSILATFDAPGQAIRCAAAIRDEAAGAGIGIACGIHTGEIDRAGEDIAGTAVRIAGGVAQRARPGEILVSRTVKDLLTGSEIGFTGRGSRQLAGAGTWPVFAVALPPAAPPSQLAAPPG